MTRHRTVRWRWLDCCTCWPQPATRSPHQRARSAAGPIECWRAAPRKVGAATGASTRRRCASAHGAGRRRWLSPAGRKGRSAGAAMRPTRICSKNVSSVGAVAGRPSDGRTVPRGASRAPLNSPAAASDAVITAERRRSLKTDQSAATATSHHRGPAVSAGGPAPSAAARPVSFPIGAAGATGRAASAWSAAGSDRAVASAVAVAHSTARRAVRAGRDAATTAARPAQSMPTGHADRSAPAATSATCAIPDDARSAGSYACWLAAPRTRRTSAGRALGPPWISPAEAVAGRAGCSPRDAAPDALLPTACTTCSATTTASW